MRAHDTRSSVRGLRRWHLRSSLSAQARILVMRVLLSRRRSMRMPRRGRTFHDFLGILMQLLGKRTQMPGPSSARTLAGMMGLAHQAIVSHASQNTNTALSAHANRETDRRGEMRPYQAFQRGLYQAAEVRTSSNDDATRNRLKSHVAERVSGFDRLKRRNPAPHNDQSGAASAGHHGNGERTMPEAQIRAFGKASKMPFQEIFRASQLAVRLKNELREPANVMSSGQDVSAFPSGFEKRDQLYEGQRIWPDHRQNTAEKNARDAKTRLSEHSETLSAEKNRRGEGQISRPDDGNRLPRPRMAGPTDRRALLTTVGVGGLQSRDTTHVDVTTYIAQRANASGQLKGKGRLRMTRPAKRVDRARAPLKTRPNAGSGDLQLFSGFRRASPTESDAGMPNFDPRARPNDISQASRLRPEAQAVARHFAPLQWPRMRHAAARWSHNSHARVDNVMSAQRGAAASWQSEGRLALSFSDGSGETHAETFAWLQTLRHAHRSIAGATHHQPRREQSRAAPATPSEASVSDTLPPQKERRADVHAPLNDDGSMFDALRLLAGQSNLGLV